MSEQETQAIYDCGCYYTEATGEFLACRKHELLFKEILNIEQKIVERKPLEIEQALDYDPNEA